MIVATDKNLNLGVYLRCRSRIGQGRLITVSVVEYCAHILQSYEDINQHTNIHTRHSSSGVRGCLITLCRHLRSFCSLSILGM